MRAGVFGQGQREWANHKEHTTVAISHAGLKRPIRDAIPLGGPMPIYALKVGNERVLGEVER